MSNPCHTYNKATLIGYELNEHGMPEEIYDVELPDGSHVTLRHRELVILRALKNYLMFNRPDCKKKMQDFFNSFIKGKDSKELRRVADILFG